MQETLHDKNGNPVAYIDYDEDATIYLWNGKPVGYLSNNNTVYGFNGSHLGWFEDGILWNLKGERSGFNKNTSPAYTKYEPYKSYKQYKPYKSYKQYAKLKPFKKLNSSDASLESHLISGAK